jgi:hypothetical protein
MPATRLTYVRPLEADDTGFIRCRAKAQHCWRAHLSGDAITRVAVNAWKTLLHLPGSTATALRPAFLPAKQECSTDLQRSPRSAPTVRRSRLGPTVFPLRFSFALVDAAGTNWWLIHDLGFQTVVVDSNHDNWLMRWLREHDYRLDPQNALLFLEAQLEVFKQMQGQNENFHLVEWAMRKFNTPEAVRFLRQDESFTICGKKIECGMHGHLGVAGARGKPASLHRIGRKANY